MKKTKYGCKDNEPHLYHEGGDILPRCKRCNAPMAERNSNAIQRDDGIWGNTGEGDERGSIDQYNGEPIPNEDEPDFDLERKARMEDEDFSAKAETDQIKEIES